MRQIQPRSGVLRSVSARLQRDGLVCRGWTQVLSGAALVAVGVPLTSFLDAALDRATRRVERRTNTDANGVRCFVASPTETASETPVVLVLHQLFGVQDREVEFCQELAEQGYIAVAVDAFQGRASKWIPRVVGFALEKVVFPKEPDYGVEAALTVLDWLKERNGGGAVSLVGFCYGGGGAIRAALAQPEAFASVGVFYGNPPESDALRRLRCPVFAAYGSADAQFSATALEAFEADLQRIPGSQFRRYQGEGHAFVTDVSATKRPGSAQEAWKAYLQFLSALSAPNRPNRI